MSIRTTERLTKDIDFVIAVTDDREAEEFVMSLSRSGYYVDTVLQQEAVDRFSAVRLLSRGESEMFFDLLFASSGIEREVVATAEKAEIFPGMVGPVATIPSLIALKVLSANMGNRLQDIIDSKISSKLPLRPTSMMPELCWISLPNAVTTAIKTSYRILKSTSGWLRARKWAQLGQTCCR